MKKLLCIFVILLSICVYPVFLRVPIEITKVFGLIEVDLFSWYRMWLVVIVGCTCLVWSVSKINKVIYAYWSLLIISTILSGYFRTSIFGSPWIHEGMIAIVGYLGLYLISKEYGLFKGLKKSFDIVIVIVFIISVFQIWYGNFLNFPLLKWLTPKLNYEAIRWPLYSTMGCADHLGLFCALFFPYALIRKKNVLALMILFMAICSESRGSWLAIALTTLFMGRRVVTHLAIASFLIAVPFYKDIGQRINMTFHDLHYPIRDKDLSGRAYMWKRSIPQMKRTLLHGNGPATFGLYFPQKEERGNEVGFKDLVVDRPHNMYIYTWVSTGLLSLLVLLYGIWIVIWNSSDPSLEMGVLSFLIAGIFTDSVIQVTPYFMIFLGCLSHKEAR